MTSLKFWNNSTPQPATGTLRFMSPEVLQSTRAFDFPADVWALGCTVIEMATGTLPFPEMEDVVSEQLCRQVYHTPFLFGFLRVKT